MSYSGDKGRRITVLGGRAYVKNKLKVKRLEQM
jgi:hypothetical protein